MAEVVYTDEARSWYESLTPKYMECMTASINRLREIGWRLGRPTADRVKTSCHHNMKELRSMGRHLRALFAFDEQRRGPAKERRRGDMSHHWEDIRRENPVNEVRVATYQRLMEAEEAIAQARNRRGESWRRIEHALARSELSDSELESEDDIFLTMLARFVAALGGHVEVWAVFADETITVRRDPDAASA